MLRIKLKVSYFEIVLNWIVDILKQYIRTIIMILNVNIKATEEKNCNIHYVLYFSKKRD